MEWIIMIICGTVASVQYSNTLPQGSTAYEEASFWLKSGQEDLQRILATKNIERQAKNIIIFIGDGMGMASITSGRIFAGQRKNSTGEEYKLSFEKFPNTGFSKTYNVNKQVPDSAGTATAIFSGAKSQYKIIGLDAKAPFNICNKTINEKSKLSTIADWAQESGMDTGFVTTTRVTHATPAALYAHVNNRDWECDSSIPIKSRNCVKDIARQLVEDAPGNKFKVILGGGGQNLGITLDDPIDVESCTRNDGKNLIQYWSKLNPKGKFVSTTEDLMSLNIQNTSSLLGIFSSSHMPFHEVKKPEVPSLANMTLQAIRMLKKNPRGFVLMVESGTIDIAHHQNYAKLALREISELDEAVNVALNNVKIEETLIIVTADHSHSFTMNGYPERGNNILGFGNDKLNPNIKPYETLSYANGPGFIYHKLNNTNSSDQIWRPVEQDTTRNNPFYRHLATFYMTDETHGGEDVGVYAIGPYSHLFRSTFEQNYIAHAIAYAGCFKNWPSHCNHPYKRYYYEVVGINSSIINSSSNAVILWSLILYLFNQVNLLI